MLVVRSLSKSFSSPADELRVLDDISLTLEAGQSAAIMGPSGSGKSTLLNILGTLEPPTAGRVTLDGRDPFALAPAELARFRNARIGFVFQEHHLLPQCSVLENVLLPTLAFGDNPEGVERARALIARVGLSDRAQHRPAELSGGERQRVALARALINRPALVLADEPTGNLDRGSAERIADLLAELAGPGGVALLVVTHAEPLARRFQRQLELVDGKLQPRQAVP